MVVTTSYHAGMYGDAPIDTVEALTDTADEFACSVRTEIRRRMKDQGISVRTMAAHLGISHVAIVKLLNGQSQMTLQRLAMMTQVLQVHVVLDRHARAIAGTPTFQWQRQREA
jgi:transcriptional regulator with XRE-family HTH domain